MNKEGVCIAAGSGTCIMQVPVQRKQRRISIVTVQGIMSGRISNENKKTHD